jgi:hypothetical protein
MDIRSTRGIRRDVRRDGVWFVGSIALGLAAACSSSSSGGAPGTKDSGAPDATAFSPLADGGSPGMGIMASCGQLATATGGTANKCAAGQTCCTMLSIASLSLISTCVAKDQCSGGTSNECQTGADCTGGQVCCSGAPGGADASTGGADASTGGGLFGGFSLATFDTTCQASCQAGQQQQCASSAECPTGQTCQASALAAVFGADGGFAFDGGFDAGFGGDAGGLGAIAIAMTCAAPVPDAGTPHEAGPSPTSDDSGTDSGQTTADQ